MRRSEIERTLSTLCETMPRGLRDSGVVANSCILAGRLGVEALRSQHLRVRPLPVRVRVMNRAYAERLGRGDKPSDEWGEAGAKIITIDEDSSGPGWSGHLVLIVQERYLLDLTANQFARPEHKIEAKSFWHEARELAQGRLFAFTNNDDGSVWLYEPWPENREYLSKPAWSGYRVRVSGNQVISERVGPAPEKVAPEIRVSLERI